MRSTAMHVLHSQTNLAQSLCNRCSQNLRNALASLFRKLDQRGGPICGQEQPNLDDLGRRRSAR